MIKTYGFYGILQLLIFKIRTKFVFYNARIIRFHLTINEKDYKRVFDGQEQSVKNHGHVLTKDCPDLYNDCDAMFLPSHLECFSAFYPEAMKMKRPILTSDLSFATIVCGDVALYFDNLNAKDISEKIKSLFHSKTLYDALKARGVERLLSFSDSRQQALKYLETCKEITSN